MDLAAVYCSYPSIKLTKYRLTKIVEEWQLDDWIDIKKDEKHVAKEREKAKKLKKSNWWKAELSRGICYYCKEKFSADELTMDHVVPLSRGGKSIKGNIVACCKECNNEKKYLTPVEMLLKELDNETDC